MTLLSIGICQGQITNLNEIEPEKKTKKASKTEAIATTNVLATEEIKPRKRLPPLLLSLQDRAPERLHVYRLQRTVDGQWMGVAFGLTSPLYNYYYKNGYGCVYIRQTENELTGEHSCIMIKVYRDKRK